MNSILKKKDMDEACVPGVSELSQILKNTIEANFENVRVRGEISASKLHTSGHFYFALKDATAVLDAVCWKGTMGRLSIKPQDGTEVICTGRLTTYPGRSKYQMIVERMEMAGEGALLKLLEERKRKLAAEGLFNVESKKSLPYLPQCIGIVTSPTGAVIQDMIHRLRDRFPRHILLWPVLVQGEGAAAQIAEAIHGFNALPENGKIPKPDLLIVARGGGSLEDLWAFNEENVVRAAAASRIPLISGVGHEPDVTLIDFAADYRAPTPSAAAEKAVPVRYDLMQAVSRLSSRLDRCIVRALEDNTLRHDERQERLERGCHICLERLQMSMKLLGQRLRHPLDTVEQGAVRLDFLWKQLGGAAIRLLDRSAHRFERVSGLLHSYSFQATLQRGFVLVRDDNGRIITSVTSCSPGMNVQLGFHDGQAGAIIAGSTPSGQKKKTHQRPASHPGLFD